VLSGCGYNNFQTLDEQVKANWAEVLNQYQRRADLIPNIVATVKGEASFEQDTLTKVIEARSKATSIQATPELVNDPAAFEKFQAAQGQLTSALSRLMVVAEQYPEPEGERGHVCQDVMRIAPRSREPHHVAKNTPRFAFRLGYCSATTIRRLSALVSWPCAAWNFSNAAGSLTSSGVAWMLVALERASITLVSVSCSKLASPLTVATMFGIRSARRWYWFSTSASWP